MARYWQPKYKAICEKCGWKGSRTKRMGSKRCPKCDHYHPKLET